MVRYNQCWVNIRYGASRVVCIVLMYIHINTIHTAQQPRTTAACAKGNNTIYYGINGARTRVHEDCTGQRKHANRLCSLDNISLAV